MTNIDLSHLPVGVYADGSPAYANLAAGNAMCQGEPGSGKSVYLSALSCSILRAVPQIQFAILSPKALDFQNFMDAVPVIQDVQEMIDYLKWVEEQGEIRKQVCMDRRIKKIGRDEWEEYPPIVIMIDEYATVYGKKLPPEPGKKQAELNVGERLGAIVKHIVAEYRFAAISVILTTQRFDNTSIDTTLRANISGTIASFATNKAMTDTMMWGDDAEDAPCFKIKKSQVGCGYIAVGGELPRAFKGALADDDDEMAATNYFLEKRRELEDAGRSRLLTYTPKADSDDDEEPEEKPAPRRRRRS